MDHISKLKGQAGLFTVDRLKRIMGLMSKAEVDMKWHPQARILLEIAVIEACGAVRSQLRPEKKISAQVVKEAVPGDLSSIKNKWQALLEEVKKRNTFAYISLHEGEPSSYENGVLTVKFKKGFAFHKERLEEASSKKAVEDALSALLGAATSIRCVVEENAARPDVNLSKVAEFFGGQVIS